MNHSIIMYDTNCVHTLLTNVRIIYVNNYWKEFKIRMLARMLYVAFIYLLGHSVSYIYEDVIHSYLFYNRQ